MDQGRIVRKSCLIIKTDEGYVIRQKIGKKKYQNVLVVPEQGTQEDTVINLALALMEDS